MKARRLPGRVAASITTAPLARAVIALAAAGCGGGDGVARAPVAAAAKGPPVELVTPSRLLPDLVGTQGFVGEEGGARRVLVDRMRVLASDDGALDRATELMPAGTVHEIKLPSRFGGGYLFYENAGGGTHVWRAPRWLAKLEPLAELPYAAESITPGLDRLYVRQNASNQLRAIDAQTGAPLSTAPLPPATAYGWVAFADGWRGLAEVDLRGVVATFDAGATWRPISIPDHVNAIQLASGDPTVFVNHGSYAVDQRGNVTFRASPSSDGSVDALAKLATQPGPLGRRPLRAALEDGFPDSADTAIVARGGAIARVSLRNGAIVAIAEDAYAERTSSCHAVKVGAGWGFICGEREGATRVYAYAPPLAMTRVLSFSSPRFVSASGNGALVVRGACADVAAPPSLGLLDDRDAPPAASASPSASASASAAPSAAPSASASASAGLPRFGPVKSGGTPYCVRTIAGVTRDVRLKGDVGFERVVALADGRVAVLVPPHAGAAGQLVLLDERGAARALPLRMPTEPKSAARELHRGLWLEGFEERDKALAGWVEAGGTTVGVTVALDGAVKAGEPREDVGGALVAGRFGLSIGDTSRAAESIDGGFTWRAFDLPDRDEAAVLATPTRACTAVGCAFGGWLRVGWGEPGAPHDLAAAETPKAPKTPMRALTSWPMTCQIVSNATPPLAAPKPAAAAHPQPPHHAPPPSRFAGAPWATAPAPQPTSPWLPFRNTPPPALGADEAGFDNGNFNEGEIAQMHAYAWGKRGADWTRAGRFVVRFDDRFDGGGGVRATSPTASPWLDEATASEGIGNGAWSSTHWSISFGADRGSLLDPSGRAALATGCHGVLCALYGLVDGQPAQQLRDAATNKPGVFPRPSSAVRVGETWFFLSPATGNESLTLYRVDLGVARALTVLHRASFTRNAPGPILVRRARSEALGVLAAAPPDPGERFGAWYVMPVDLETGELGEPVNLGRKDFDGKGPVKCAPTQDGWTFDVPTEVTAPLDFVDATVTPESLELRLRLDPGSACVDSMATRLSGAVVKGAPHAPAAPPPAGAHAVEKPAAIDERTALSLAATERSSGRRWSFRCAVRPNK